MSTPQQRVFARRLSGVGALGVLIHLVFLGLGSYRQSYDAYTHIFFASHWLHHWWSAFEPRWYTGFSVFTYPPFSHQLIALPAFIVGLEPAFLAVQSLCLVALATGMYRYARIWCTPPVATLAAVLLVFSPALAMTLHLFGQYPNLISLALTLHVLAFVHGFLREDGSPQHRWQQLLAGELLLISTAFTSLFANFLGVFFFALPILIKHWRKEALGRIGLLLLLGGGTLVACLTPFFAYMRVHPLVQVSIPHASRDNVLQMSLLNYFTFYGLYGAVLPGLLCWLVYALWKRRHLAFVFPVLFLLLLSTGGATPFNAWLLGPLFDVLTFDRFAFWNSILILPVLADLLWRVFASLRRQGLPQPFWWGGVGLLAVAYLVGFALNISAYRWWPLPPALHLAGIQEVLDRPAYQQRRYLTLGLGGNNVSALSAYHPAESLDGNYNFARRIPELNQAPIALLDDAKYYGEPGIDALAKLLLDPRKYALQVLFLRDQYYTPLLQASGWRQVDRLDQGIEVWEPGVVIPALPPVEQRGSSAHAPGADFGQRSWFQWVWSVLPLSGFFLALCWVTYLAYAKYARADRTAFTSEDGSL